MSRPDEPPPPPSYEILPQARQPVPADSLAKRSHDLVRADRYTGHLALQLLTLDPLHVGAGAPVLLNDQIARATLYVADAAGDAIMPIIPGSSIKGAVRNIAESLLGGGAPSDADVGSSAAGTLFGYAGDRAEAFASRIGFDDAHPSTGADTPAGLFRLPMAFRPRKSAGRRIYGPPKHLGQAQVPYEVVDRGTRFDTRLHLVNVSLAEMGLVLLCLGVDGSFELRIGGGKFAGLGRVRATVTGAKLRRDYRKADPEVLDAEATRELVEKALEKPLLSKEAEAPLVILRRTLGRGAT